MNRKERSEASSTDRHNNLVVNKTNSVAMRIVKYFIMTRLYPIKTILHCLWSTKLAGKRQVAKENIYLVKACSEIHNFSPSASLTRDKIKKWTKITKIQWNYTRTLTISQRITKSSACACVCARVCVREKAVMLQQ